MLSRINTSQHAIHKRGGDIGFCDTIQNHVQDFEAFGEKQGQGDGTGKEKEAT